MSAETLKTQLETIQSASNDIQTAIENEGETVSGGITSYAAAIPNLASVKTVNGIAADSSKNVTIDASNINVDETASTKESIKAFLGNVVKTDDLSTSVSTAIQNYFKDSEEIKPTESHSGTYYFAYDSSTSVYASNNNGVVSSDAGSTFTFTNDYDSVLISYSVSSESNYDKLTITLNGSTTIVSEISGEQTGTYTTKITSGDTVEVHYVKDSSGDSGSDKATISFKTASNKDWLSTNATSDDEKPATVAYVDSKTSSTATIEEISLRKEIYTSAFNNWDSYDDGADLTDTVSFSLDDYTNLYPGNVIAYITTDMGTGYSATYYDLITNQYSTYTYRSAGGRFYIRYVTMNNRQYIFSGDVMGFANNHVYKGTLLDEGSSSGDSGAKACFTADTQVLTENGLKNISDIKVGDKVLSYNRYKKATEYKEVDKLITHGTDKIYNVVIKDETIKTTGTHPFFVANEVKGFSGIVEARGLVKDKDELMSKEGNRYKLLDLTTEDKAETVYEIRVKDNNNYFVGNTGILVYNESSVLADK